MFNDIKHVDLNLLSINKKRLKNTDVVTHEIKSITTQNINNQNINNEVPLCICLSDVRAYIIEELLWQKVTKNVKDVKKTFE